MTEATTLAAGAAIWRPPADPADDAEVLLVHRPTYDDWSLPKGKSDAGEHIGEVFPVQAQNGRTTLGQEAGE